MKKIREGEREMSEIKRENEKRKRNIIIKIEKKLCCRENRNRDRDEEILRENKESK